MIPIAEFQRRALTGPVMREPEFDKAFSLKVRELVARYEIKYDPENIIVSDQMADAVFQAGVDLLVDIGLYHRDTQRVIQLSREEVDQIVSEAWNGPRKESFGKGKDAITFQHRTCEDPRPPAFLLGTTGTASTEELYFPWLQSFAQEESADGMLSFGVIAATAGVQNKAGTPGELICTQTEVERAQEVSRRVGKPDRFLGRSSATSPAGIMALFRPGGLERHNSVVPIHIMPEQKLDWTRLVLARFLQQRGIIPWTTAISIMGALCRGPEDSAVAQIANMLAQLGYGRGTMANTSAIGLDGGVTGREPLWSFSAAARAAERHIGIPIGVPSIQSVAGAGTEMSFYEKAGMTLACVGSGTAWVGGVGCRNGQGINTNTGLEGRIIGETLRAVSGMSRNKANELLNRIFPLYEGQFSSAPEGRTFAELYDVEAIQPVPDYLALYQRVKEHLASLGVPY